MARYSRSAGKDVKRAMHKRKHGTLKRGKHGHGGKGEEPQAGDRYRSLRSAQEGQEGAAQVETQIRSQAQAQVIEAASRGPSRIATKAPPIQGRRKKVLPLGIIGFEVSFV